MFQPLVSGVSDTARWVAAYRAAETARPDALFRDPLADRLAGERGRAIAAAAPRSMRSGWPMITRTKLIDDLIARALVDGCDCVLNLAAGLDTRPYRLDVPETFAWIEADLPAMIDEKEQLLLAEKPRCRLTRERIDLADVRARNAFISRATSQASKVLVITEGLLTYLDDRSVCALAKDLARPPIRWWVLDVVSAAIAWTLKRYLDNAPMKFTPPKGVAFFEANGDWEAREIYSLYREAIRFNRLPLWLRVLSLLGDPDPRNPGTKIWSAVVRLEQSTLAKRWNSE